jgi:Rod binding domain-containing protein
MDASPIIDSTQLPADIRTASKPDQARYSAAMQFEQMLVQNMMTQMTDSAKASASDDGGSTDDGGDDTSGGGTDAVSNSYASQMPDILSQVVTQGGGLGLARQMYDSMKQQES